MASKRSGRPIISMRSTPTPIETSFSLRFLWKLFQGLFEWGTGEGVVQWVESRKSNQRSMVSIRPWQGPAGQGTLFLSIRVNSYTLLMPNSPSCVRHAPECCARVQDPISIICRKNTKTLHTDTKAGLIAPYYGCSFSLGTAA